MTTQILLLGAAGSQAEHHIRALEVLRSEGVAIPAGAVDLNLEDAQEVGDRLSVPAFGSLEAAIGAVQFDAAIVATPNSTHVDLGCELMDHGKHVLVEKPLAPSTAGGRRLLQRAEKRLCLLAGEYPWVVRTLWGARQVREGAIGVPMYAYLEFALADSIPLRPGFLDRNTGGARRDLAGHPLVALASFTDERPVAVSATSVYESVEVDGTVFPDVEIGTDATIRYSDGLVAELHVSWRDGKFPPKRMRVDVWGDAGQGAGSWIENPLFDPMEVGQDEDTRHCEPTLHVFGHDVVVGPPPPTYSESVTEVDRNFALAVEVASSGVNRDRAAWRRGLDALHLSPYAAIDAERTVTAIGASASRNRASGQTQWVVA